MYPTLFPIGSYFTVTSFGLFLVLSFLSAAFVVWRLSRVYDFSEEKVLDIFFYVTFFSLIGGRITHVILNLDQFSEISKIFIFFKYPGFSFWGGLVFGIIALIFICKWLRINFFLSGDIAAVALFIGLFFSSLGCFLGSCQYGLESNLFFAIPQVGLIGKRFPIQIIFGIFYLIIFYNLWKSCLRFHFTGKIFSLGLILLGVVKFSLEFLRADSPILLYQFKLGHLFSLLTIIFGIYFYYKLGKRSLARDLQGLIRFFINSKQRQVTLSKLNRSWYNLKINWKISLTKNSKRLFRKLNVKSNPT